MRKTALILAPHPDDESITGLLPLRLQEECGFKVIVIPITWGSRLERQSARKREMKAACAQLEFGLRYLKEPPDSEARIRELSDRILRLSPTVIFMPHLKDGHATHQQAHRMGVAALDLSPNQRFHVVETEYWHPLARPNLMVAADEADLASLCGALSCHKGEITRNDYAARLPAWMIDNVRRGSELVRGAGTSALPIEYATLYRARRRERQGWRAEFQRGRVIESSEELGALAACWSS
jgi:N-acetylglucosamine malate deacetylase 1